MLDEGLLAELERRWRDQSPALVERLAPGLSDEEIDRLVEPLDYSLPEEVRRWFRWHDGSSNRPVIFTRAFTPLRDSISLSAGFADMDETRPDDWLNVMDEKPYVIFDCRGETIAPVWHLEYSFDLDSPTRPVFESIGDMVAFWIELIDDDQIFWSSDGEWGIREPVPETVSHRIWGVPTD
jgi:hypothetical protein